MTVKELKEAIKDLPDDMDVVGDLTGSVMDYFVCTGAVVEQPKYFREPVLMIRWEL